MVNGEFKFEGTVDAPKMAYVDYGISYAQIHMILENATYEITSDALESINNTYKTDSKEHGIFSLFLKNDFTYTSMRRNFDKEAEKARMKNDVVAYDKIISKYSPTYIEQRRAEDEIIKKHPNSLAALGAVYKWRNDAKEDEMAMRFSLLGDKYAHLNTYQRLLGQQKAIENSKIGRTVPNFTMEDINGKKISLYDIKGEIKVIDFGASWCGPCRALNPIMLALYNKYNKKGFEIIGVSLDTKRDDWVEAVEKDKLPWAQVSELKGWETGIAVDFNVGGIPFLIVLDSENRILGVDVNESQIEDLLKRMYDEKK